MKIAHEHHCSAPLSPSFFFSCCFIFFFLRCLSPLPLLPPSSFSSCFFFCLSTSQSQYLFLLERQQCFQYAHFHTVCCAAVGEQHRGDFCCLLFYLPEMPRLCSSSLLLVALLLLLLPVHSTKQCVVRCRGRAAHRDLSSCLLFFVFLRCPSSLLFQLLLLLLLPVHITKQCVVYCRGRAARGCTRAWRGWGPCATSTAPCCWWTPCAAWGGCPSLPMTGGWTACTPAPRSASAHRQVTDTTDGSSCQKSLFLTALTA